MRIVSLLIFALFLSSCATPGSAPPTIADPAIVAEQRKQLAHRLDRHLAGLKSVQTVGHRVLVASHKFCGEDVGPRFGFGAATLKDISKDWRGIAENKLGMGEALSIVYVADNSPASRAGLQVGDKIIAIRSKKAPQGDGATSAFFDMLADHKGSRALKIMISRQGAAKTFALKPDFGCRYPIQFGDGSEPDAFTDGNKIYISRGLLKVATSQEELAFVVAHELAHITRGHLSKKRQNQIAGMAGGLLVDVAFAAVGVNTGGAFMESGGNLGLVAYSQGFEKEADYAGMYYAANAGYRTQGVEGFWRKMADESPKSIQFAGTHPTSPERFLLLQKTHLEIEQKRAAGLPLVPTEKVQEASAE